MEWFEWIEFLKLPLSVVGLYFLLIDVIPLQINTAGAVICCIVYLSAAFEADLLLSRKRERERE